MRITIEVDAISFQGEDVAHDLRLLFIALIDMSFGLFQGVRLDVDQFMLNFLDSVRAHLLIQEVLKQVQGLTVLALCRNVAPEITLVYFFGNIFATFRHEIFVDRLF